MDLLDFHYRYFLKHPFFSHLFYIQFMVQKGKNAVSNLMPTTITELFLNRTKQYQLLPIDTLFELLHVSDAIIWIAAKTSSLLLDWFQSRRELTWESGSEA